MRTKKIRGIKRRYKIIDKWVEANRHPDIKILKKNKRDHVKIHIPPWNGISVTNSKYPEIKGKIKLRVLEKLIEIYNEWKENLNKLGEPYYLKIWLFDPNFSESQVVCAIGYMKDFYNNTFNNPVESKEFSLEKYGRLNTILGSFLWEHYIEETNFTNLDIGTPNDFDSFEEFIKNKNYYMKKLEKPHRVVKYSKPIGGIKKMYCLKKGDVWVGERRE